MILVDPVSQIVDLAETVEGVFRAVVAHRPDPRDRRCLRPLGAGVGSPRDLALLHLYTYVAVALAFTHQVAVGTTFTASSAATAYWYGVLGRRPRLGLPGPPRLRCGATGVTSCASRRSYPRPTTSSRVHHRHATWTDARPGRPVLPVAVPDHGPLVAGEPLLPVGRARRHPRLTAKAAGEAPRGLRHLKPGTRVFGEAPTAPSRATSTAPARRRCSSPAASASPRPRAPRGVIGHTVVDVPRGRRTRRRPCSTCRTTSRRPEGAELPPGHRAAGGPAGWRRASCTHLGAGHRAA